MKLKNISNLIIGIIFALTVLMGILMIFSQDTANIPGGIAVLCISIASGLIIPNPLSFNGLICGILMIFLPPWIAGTVIICFGTAGAVTNLFIYLKGSEIKKS